MLEGKRYMYLHYKTPVGRPAMQICYVLKKAHGLKDLISNSLDSLYVILAHYSCWGSKDAVQMEAGGVGDVCLGDV
jgi:hypothetical protein